MFEKWHHCIIKVFKNGINALLKNKNKTKIVTINVDYTLISQLVL